MCTYFEYQLKRKLNYEPKDRDLVDFNASTTIVTHGIEVTEIKFNENQKPEKPVKK